jgi:hypothetical protein
MKVLKLFYIYNLIEEKLIFNSNVEKEYVDRVRLIAEENGDNPTLESYEDCDAYILDFCSNLSLEPEWLFN